MSNDLMFDNNFSTKKDYNYLDFKTKNINESFDKTIFTSIFTNIFNKNYYILVNNNINNVLILNKYNNYFNYNNHGIMYNFKNSNFLSALEKKFKIIHKTLDIKYNILYLYKNYFTKLYFNNLNFNYINIYNLKKILFKLYNKHININIINFKYLHLDNGLYVESIVKKLKKRNTNVLKVLRKALILPKIPKINSMFLLKKKIDYTKIDDLYNIFNIYKYRNITLKKNIFESIKNIHLIGIKLHGKGRLTKRLTASRAVYKKINLGSLKNVYSSSIGLSTLMLKGTTKSNLNCVNLNSYNRNGSYGIKS
jgi:hypothetical protein